MYTVAVKQDFVAWHYLIGGDWGAENQPHTHNYQVEVQLEGADLDRHGYLVDIVLVENLLGELVSRYREHTLNDLPEFTGLNPSIEHFSRILGQELSARIPAANILALTIKLWESETAWASYRVERVDIHR